MKQFTVHERAFWVDSPSFELSFGPELFRLVTSQSLFFLSDLSDSGFCHITDPDLTNGAYKNFRPCEAVEASLRPCCLRTFCS